MGLAFWYEAAGLLLAGDLFLCRNDEPMSQASQAAAIPCYVVGGLFYYVVTFNRQNLPRY